MPKLHFLERKCCSAICHCVCSIFFCVCYIYMYRKSYNILHAKTQKLIFSHFSWILTTVSGWDCYSALFLVCLILGLIFGVCIYMNFWVIFISPASLHFVNTRPCLLLHFISGFLDTYFRNNDYNNPLFLCEGSLYFSNTYKADSCLVLM